MAAQAASAFRLRLCLGNSGLVGPGPRAGRQGLAPAGKILFVKVGAQHRGFTKQGKSVAHFGLAGHILKMQGFGHRIRIARVQQHQLALVACRPALGPAPQGKAHALAGLGLTPKAQAQTPQRQGFQHHAALLQYARKGHDAAFHGICAFCLLPCHVGSQTCTVHAHARLIVHGKGQLGAAHILRIQRMPGAQTGPYNRGHYGVGHAHRFHARKGSPRQLVARATPAGGKQQGYLPTANAGGQHV